MTNKKEEGASNGVPKWMWKTLIALAVIVVIATGGGMRGVINFLNREPKQKIIYKGIHGQGCRLPVEVISQGARSKVIRLVTYDYFGRSTLRWFLIIPWPTHKWEKAGTLDLYPSNKFPPYNYGGFWKDRSRGKIAVWFKFNKERTRAKGKVFFRGKWRDCWLQL